MQFPYGHSIKKLDADYSTIHIRRCVSYWVYQDYHTVRVEPGCASEIHTVLSAFSAGFHNFIIFLPEYNVTRCPFVLVNLTDSFNKEAQRSNTRFWTRTCLSLCVYFSSDSENKIYNKQINKTVNYMLQTSSWESDSSSTSQESCRSSWKQNVDYRVHKSPPRIPMLSQINPVYILPSYIFKIHLLPSVSAETFEASFCL